MSNIRPVTEKLYLCKGKEETDDIYIEYALQQHHIDGIRFLYKQFKSNKPGIILNNPHGYGNSLQVTLFLCAIKRLLEKPILILCDDGKEYNWLELFQRVAEDSNVIVNASEPFVKKFIFIKNMDGLVDFTRRSWSIVVVDNDALLKMKAVQNKLAADYKIWITPVDVKEHLQTFTLIYKWIYPKENFNPEDFKGKPGDRKDIILKKIQLSSFLKDTVFKTTYITPFENPFENEVKSQQTVSKKNKDSTGTKIKRTKRIIEDTNIEKNEAGEGVSAAKISKVRNGELPTDNCVVSDLHNCKSDKEESDIMEIDSKHSDLNIETFISSKDPINKHMQDFDNIFNDSQDNKTTMEYDSDPILDARDKETLINEDSNIKSNGISINEDIPIKNMSQDSDDNAYDLETQEFLNDNNVKINDSQNKINIVEKCQDVEKQCGLNERTSLESHISNNDEEIVVSNLTTSVQIDETNEIQKQVKDIQHNVKRKDEDMTAEMSQNDKIECKNKPSKIDTQIAEHEDRIFKKFKGTFLDSLF